MKLNRLRKNMRYTIAYSGSFKSFKKNLRASTDKGLSRIPARKLKAEWEQVMLEMMRIQQREDLKAITFGIRYGIGYAEETLNNIAKMFAEIDAGEVR